MHDAGGVRRIQRVGYLDSEAEKVGWFEGLARDALLERLPFEQFHHDKRQAFMFANIVNRANVRVMQC
jgi:hypothetical protein